MIEITNLTKEKIGAGFLKKVAEKATEVLGKKNLAEISLVLVGDAKMKEINKRYRGKNSTTDVLSFDGLNEILICYPQAKRQARLALKKGKANRAKALKTSLKDELTRLLVHGIVHLAGYDHERSGTAAKEMFKIENKILAKLIGF